MGVRWWGFTKILTPLKPLYVRARQFACVRRFLRVLNNLSTALLLLLLQLLRQKKYPVNGNRLRLPMFVMCARFFM